MKLRRGNEKEEKSISTTQEDGLSYYNTMLQNIQTYVTFHVNLLSFNYYLKQVCQHNYPELTEFT